MLATLLRPDAGRATVLGHDLVTEAHEIRRRISLTGQYASVDENLTGVENLVMIGRLLGYSGRQARERAEELLAGFDLEEAAKRQAKGYSGGMRRRLDIAASIVVTPELLFLDEPTAGLDPRSRNQVWDIVRTLVDMGTTVLLTTQYLDEADQLADRIAVIDRGKIIADGTIAELKASVGSGMLHLRLLDSAMRPQAERLLTEKLNLKIQPASDTAAFSVVADAERAVAALGELAAADIRVADFSLGEPSLDEVFFTLTGHPAEDKPSNGGEQ
jgi:ABC-2 type transport system ATP-binding protein